MIVTDHFVFVHLHKCGGSFVNEVLTRFFPSARRVGYHYPRSMIPGTHRGLPVLGVLRNPWDFYVSYHHFQLAVLKHNDARRAALGAEQARALIAAGHDLDNGLDVVFEALTRRGTSTFAAACRGYLGLLRDRHVFEEVLARLPDELDRRARGEPFARDDAFRGMNVRRADLRAARGQAGGLYTFLFHHMFGDGQGMDFLRLERLRDDLLGWFERREIPVSDAMATFIRSTDRVNASLHAPYRTCYDEALAELVRRTDDALIERFGDSF